MKIFKISNFYVLFLILEQILLILNLKYKYFKKYIII